MGATVDDGAQPYLPAGAASDQAFDAAFPGLFKSAYGVARRVLRDSDMAADAAAEALARTLAAWRRVSRLPYRDAWVRRVAANVSYDMLRRRKGEPLETKLDDGLADVVAARVDLRAALMVLPRRQRETVVLRYLADLSEAQTAEVLSLSVGTVKRHLHRALQTLRNHMGETTALLGEENA